MSFSLEIKQEQPTVYYNNPLQNQSLNVRFANNKPIGSLFMYLIHKTASCAYQFFAVLTLPIVLFVYVVDIATFGLMRLVFGSPKLQVNIITNSNRDDSSNSDDTSNSCSDNTGYISDSTSYSSDSTSCGDSTSSSYSLSDEVLELDIYMTCTIC